MVKNNNGNMSNKDILKYLMRKIDNIDDKLDNKVDKKTFYWMLGIVFSLLIGLIAITNGWR